MQLLNARPDDALTLQTSAGPRSVVLKMGFSHRAVSLYLPQLYQYLSTLCYHIVHAVDPQTGLTSNLTSSDLWISTMPNSGTNNPAQANVVAGRSQSQTVSSNLTRWRVVSLEPMI